MKLRAGSTLVLLVACSSPAPSAPRAPQEGGNPMPPLLERYETDRDALRRTYSVPMSPRRAERMKAFLEASRKDLDRIDFDALGVEGRIDHLLFRTHLERERRHRALETKKDAEIAALVPFRETLAQLEESRRKMETIDPEKAAERLTALSKEVEETRKGADKADRVAARRAAQRVFALRDALRSWYRFYAGYHPEFTWWVEKPYEKTQKELESYGAHLRDKIAKENE